MPCFSRTRSASASGPCVACCQAGRAADDRLSQAAADRMAALAARPAHAATAGAAAPASAYGAPGGGGVGTCAQRAAALGPVRARFDRYREALPSARAAADLSELGDEPGDAPTRKECLTRLPLDAPLLDRALGLPSGTLRPSDLRDDDTGFRAAMYRDEQTGKLILVPRDTQPDSLADWQVNTRNGVGQDTPQYRSMRTLTSTLAANGQSFDIAGYSKGGGLAQEGGLIAEAAQVRVFNSAGLPDSSLERTGQSSFENLASRTRAFSAQGDFLTFMNGTHDPGQIILNARYLRNELAGQGSLAAPINILTRNPAARGTVDTSFLDAKAQYLAELDEHIDGLQSAYDGGAAVAGFPPVRAASKESIADSSTWVGSLLGADGDRPRLGKLNQHKMSVVLDALEADVKNDREQLRGFLRHCG